MIFALIHVVCILACIFLWVIHVVALIAFDPDRVIIPTSFWRKLLLVIIYCLFISVPEISVYLSYRYLATDIALLRRYYEQQKYYTRDKLGH